MISFAVSLLLLVLGYLFYGKLVERIFQPDDRPTPAISNADGVDYIAMPAWKVYMIQFLNIAGTGPIFGAIMGAWYGPAAYFWIVLGCIFAGSVHDYFSGMLSVRHNGCNLPELVGNYLGLNAKRVMLIFSVFLLMMVGVVFVYSPALVLDTFGWSTMGWVLVIFIYYILATLLPIDKIIGRIYPFFAFAMLFMAVALMVVLFIRMPVLPEVWDNVSATQSQPLLGITPYMAKNPLFPCLFLTIACGAISGFHGTQSPLMARCIKSERMGRRIFYGAMITEGIVALIWATVSMYFFYYGGWREVVDNDTVKAFMAQSQGGKTLIQYFTAPTVVQQVCTGWLGLFGGALAIIGVVAAPITSGDTAFRSARLIIADALHLSQRPLRNRLLIAVPMFAAATGLLVWQETNPDGFNTIWQWFGWSNQTLSIFTLWTITVYLVQQKKPFIITFIPAVFMTVVCSTFLLISPMAFDLGSTVSYCGSCVACVVACVWFFAWYRKQGIANRQNNR